MTFFKESGAAVQKFSCWVFFYSQIKVAAAATIVTGSSRESTISYIHRLAFLAMQANQEGLKMVFSAILSCFVPSSSSSRVFNDAGGSSVKGPKSKSSKSSSRAPIPVSYFPVNSYLSRL
ncbi:hypothetical protein PVL29_017751 [Vitis rotundifolia]|uniref:Uncharacterized protein n=1 Tax=Vitis rotundifolia TaxID=103349 RepID=A0AA38ZCC9_VITRO|nr:hypothetical protein PVL29_017713 [Vitis rotundifolia]KAJ9685814.1 hypothetical protein PVL29_017751 [Vitis rotundifolia]